MLVLFVLLLICKLEATSGFKDVEPNGTRNGVVSMPSSSAHVCERLEKFEIQEKQTYTRLVSENYRYCCERFILCMRYCPDVRYRTISSTKLVPTHGHKIIKYCCEGWIKKDQECIPVCDFPCLHGTCIQPNFCACADGYNGKSCQKKIKKPTSKPVDKNSNNGQNNSNESPREENNYWSWLVPTILFILFIIALMIVYKRRQESIYKETLLVDKSKVQYNSLENEAYSSGSFDIEDGRCLGDKV